MTKTVYRTAGGVRRSPQPRNAGRLTGSFEGMLSKLGLASAKLNKVRRKR